MRRASAALRLVTEEARSESAELTIRYLQQELQRAAAARDAAESTRDVALFGLRLAMRELARVRGLLVAVAISRGLFTEHPRIRAVRSAGKPRRTS